MDDAPAEPLSLPAPASGTRAEEVSHSDRVYASYQAEKRVAIRRARSDVCAFSEYVMRNEAGDPIRLSGCHVDLHSHFDRNRLALLSMHRGCGKSFSTSVTRTLHTLGDDPEVRIKIATSEDTLAVKRVRVVKNYIEQSAQLREVFPHLRRNPRMKSGWTDHAIFVDRKSIDLEPSLEGRGILSSVAGGRCDVLIGDDVCDFANSVASPAKRGSVRSSWFEAWYNMLVPGGRVWYIYTPWHQDDLSAHLEGLASSTSGSWSSLRMGVEEIGGRLIPVWPEVWSEARLRQRAQDIGPTAFARGFLLRAISDSDCPLLPYVGCARSEMSPEFLHQGDAASWSRVIGVDPAITVDTSTRRATRRHSETVIVVLALAPDGTKWVDPVHCFRGRLEYPDIVRRIVETSKATNASLVMVESNAFQKSIIQGIQQQFPGAAIPIQGWNTGTEKRDERIGVPGMSAELAAGGWRFPFGPGEHPMSCECFLCVLSEQARQWPVGDRDDAVMAWWIASHAAREAGAVLASERTRWQEDVLTGEDVDGGADLLDGYDDDYWR